MTVNARLSKGQKLLSRREFLKNAGLIIGGATIASAMTGSSCKSKEVTTPVVSSSVSAASTSSVATDTGVSILSTITYVTPSEVPPVLVDYPGLTSIVPTDRRYSYEHVWVKTLSLDTVVIGITDKLQKTLMELEALLLAPTDSLLLKGDRLGVANSHKLNIDIFTPVSGIVIQENEDVKASIKTINDDPYVKGWLVVIHLSNPEEIRGLLTPEEYADIIAKI